MRTTPHVAGALDAPLTRRAVLRGSAAALAAAGAGSLLGGCGGGSSTDGASERAGITFLNILPLTSLTFAPELLADAGGFFADQGLDVTFQTTRGSAQAIQLVLAGSAPLSRIGQIEAMIHASNRDAPIMNVSAVIKESTIRFVSGAAAPLREPRDLVGKTLGIPSEGGESEITLDLLLASSGLELDSVNRQIVGVGPGVFNLVEQGRIAGFIVSIDTAKILERQNPSVTVLDPAEFIESGAQFYMTSRDGLAEHREPIRKYLAAVQAAVEFMIGDDGFDETLRLMRQKYSFGTLQDDVVAKDSLQEYVRVWTSEGRANLMRTAAESWQRGYEELTRVGQAAPGKDPAAWYTNDLLPAG